MLVILVWDIEYVKCEVGFSHLCFKKLLNGSNVYHSLRTFDGGIIGDLWESCSNDSGGGYQPEP